MKESLAKERKKVEQTVVVGGVCAFLSEMNRLESHRISQKSVNKQVKQMNLTAFNKSFTPY